MNNFPKIDNINSLQYDDEGLWSISIPEDADKIAYIIKTHINNNNKILDGTAGLGGNVFSFSKYFKYVRAIELNYNRYLMLQNNIKAYNLNNVSVYNGNCIDYLDDTYDAYFFDPPWGGPNYKYNKSMRLKISNNKLINIVNNIRRINNSIIFFKLPYNYDLDEFNLFNYKLFKINNYLLIAIY